MIYGYSRVSSVEQASDGKSSLDDQERVIQGVAMIHGIASVTMFRDIGISGSVPLRERPGGRALLEAVKPGDWILASKMDRMFRSTRDALVMVEDLRKVGIGVVLADISNTPLNDTGTGAFLLNIKAAVADLERDMIRERTAAGRASKKARGGHVGGDAPYGYRKIGTGAAAMLEADEDEQKIISQMRSMKDSGYSFTRIANTLNDLGVSAREGKWWQRQIMRALERT